MSQYELKKVLSRANDNSTTKLLAMKIGQIRTWNPKARHRIQIAAKREGVLIEVWQDDGVLFVKRLG